MPRHLFSLLILAIAASAVAQDVKPAPIRPGHPEWPVAWTTYRKVESLEADLADMKAHGVGLISAETSRLDEARRLLAAVRKEGMKLHIRMPEITESVSQVKSAGLQPVEALMIGGVYDGRAIDRHLYTFTAKKHQVIIEPPVYNRGFAYTRGSNATGSPKDAEKVGHYFPDMPEPVRAEVIVPLKRFDGRQHLKIIPAAIAPAPAGAKPSNDSVTPDMPASSETADRRLYQLSFDLTGLDGAMLDHVGIAVYWPYRGSKAYWMFANGNVSAAAQSTRDALRHHARSTLAMWAEANGGTFPIDTVIAARFGDECFHITSHLNGPACSYPLWDFSEPAIAAFQSAIGNEQSALTHPRTWGFPEVYGADAYAFWMYSFHRNCAQLAGIIREEIARTAPGLLLFRNTTRMGVFDLVNDHDGSGQELLARNLDVVHVDPYPVSARGYGANIPVDMSYCAGLARRYNRLLVPWMQAHTYGGPTGLTDVSPQDVGRMAGEQYAHGVDAIMWLGYGHTFPKVRSDSWERAAAFHQRLKQSPSPKPKARLAVIRPYTTRALSSRWESKLRNPADWMMQQALYVWAVEQHQSYDVFELSPGLSADERTRVEQAVKQYPLVLSTIPWLNAWVIGQGTETQVVDTSTAPKVRQAMLEELNRRRWLP